jgi:hypothetical protein
MQMQQFGTKTWPIILVLAEKHMFTVDVFAQLFIRLQEMYVKFWKEMEII